MKYILDPNKLFQSICDKDDNQRGQYILKACIALMEGTPLAWAVKQPKERSKEAAGEYSEDFETFWNEYPKKVNKMGAYLVWKKSKVPLQDAINALGWQKKSQQWCSEGGKFIPNAETYITKRRWEDEAPAAQAGGGEKYLTPDGVWRTR